MANLRKSPEAIRHLKLMYIRKSSKRETRNTTSGRSREHWSTAISYPPLRLSCFHISMTSSHHLSSLVGRVSESHHHKKQNYLSRRYHSGTQEKGKNQIPIADNKSPISRFRFSKGEHGTKSQTLPPLRVEGPTILQLSMG